jgi:hypothetical protein
MTKELLQEATTLANKLCALAKSGDPRLIRLADMACSREHRRYRMWDAQKSLPPPQPYSLRLGKPYLKERPRAGVWRGKR